MKEFECSILNLFDSSVATNKVLQRKIWEATKVIQPNYDVFSSKSMALSNALSRKLPFVIKPADSSGSRGVAVIARNENISSEIENAFAYSKSHTILIEDFMIGSEFTVEVFAYDGEIIPILVTKKDKVGKEVLTVSKALWTVNPGNHLYSTIVANALQAFTSLGLKNGPGHLEMIVDEGKGPVGIVEAAFRGGGFNLSTKLIYVATGFNFTNASLSIFDKTLPKVASQFYRPSVLFFYPSQKGQLLAIQGLNEVNQLPEVEIDLLTTIGEFYEQPKTDGDRLCTIVVSAESDEILMEKKKYIESILFFHFEV
jgi:carbamoylphosphate synthase large subunit